MNESTLFIIGANMFQIIEGYLSYPRGFISRFQYL